MSLTKENKEGWTNKGPTQSGFYWILEKRIVIRDGQEHVTWATNMAWVECGSSGCWWTLLTGFTENPMPVAPYYENMWWWYLPFPPITQIIESQ